jgi:glycosyltransferase involved in cell wall biosynthesis
MKNDKINVLHIDTEYGWRGGQQQAIYLFEKLLGKGFISAMVCQPNSALSSYCQVHQLPHFDLRMRGESDLLAGFRIAKICKKNEFNILHLHSAHAVTIGIWAKLFLPKLKLIAVRRVDFHINVFFSKLKYDNRYLDKIVCISNKIKEVLLKDGIKSDRLLTIHSGIDTDKFKGLTDASSLRSEMGIPENDVVVGTVAAIVGHKDYPNLLKAAKIVLNRKSNVTFCAVGSGSEKERIHELANRLNLGEKFIFAGFREDIGRFLKMFDIFVLASKKEGLGTSILDAQAMGLPVVGTRAGGIPEAVHHNVNGVLVPPKNETALAEAIIELIGDESKRKKLGKAARETVKKFDINITVAKNIELYKQLLDA